jgi:ERF superfamily
MNRSETITKIAAALVKAQADMGNAKKDAVNPFFKKNYADLNAIREAVLPALNAQGISVIQPTCVLEGKNYVETVLLHESGEFISSLTEIVVDKVNDAQRHGSGLSYARRYALQSITNIGAEDDDAQAAVGKPSKQEESAINPIARPLAAMYAAKSINDLMAVWKANGQFHKDAAFLSAKESMKQKLTPQQQPAL